MPGITFILEPDMGRVTVETSSIEDTEVSSEIKRLLGPGTPLNCARPALTDISRPILSGDKDLSEKCLYLFRIYHGSTVDGPGRRSVIQFAGCSIRCPGCYVPETHERNNGQLTPVSEIVRQIKERSGEHDGVTIIGGEPFDQVEGLEELVTGLKAFSFDLTIYSGYLLEDLLAREDPRIDYILGKIDLLIDGPFKKDLARGAGNYRGSGNQRLIFNPMGKKDDG